MADTVGIIDTISDDVAQWISVLTGHPTTVPTTAQTTAAVALAQQRQQQNTMLIFGAMILAVVYFSSRR